MVFRATDAGAERVGFPDADAAPAHTLTGPAGDLLLMAWRRLPLSAVVVEGDADKADALLASVTLE
ncbi:MDMPI C-terminal domain-containing protein [Modestobacter sp. DSM 44400]|nr:MDMPI C-terminal domain-containing protein [Modestobacter sp. DSM 44400]